MRKVLIITIAYPPANFVAGRRAEGWVKHLPAFGYEPYVLTRYYDPDARGGWDFQATKRAPKELTKPWLKVGNITYTNFSSSYCNLPNIPSYLRALLYYALPDPDHHGWYKSCLEYVKSIEIKPDIIIASFEPSIVFKIAPAYAKKFNVPWVADYRDLWISENEHNGSRSKKIKYWLQRQHVKTASGFISVTDGMEMTLREQLALPHLKSKVIYNGAEPYDLPEPHQDDVDSIEVFNVLKREYKIILCYTGTLYKQQQIDELFKAVNTFNKDKKRRCAVLLCGNYQDSDYNSWDFVHVIKPVKHQTSLFLQSSCDANFYPTWPSRDSIFSGKIFEQMIAGNPLIVFPSPSYDLEAFCRNLASVLICKSQEALLNALQLIDSGKFNNAKRSINEIVTKRYWARELSEYLDLIV